MTAVEIIEEIKRLPREEKNRVIEFARQAGEDRPLSPEAWGKLARQMVEAQDPTEADRLQKEIERGFYGGQKQAKVKLSEDSLKNVWENDVDDVFNELLSK